MQHDACCKWVKELPGEPARLALAVMLHTCPVQKLLTSFMSILQAAQASFGWPEQ